MRDLLIINRTNKTSTLGNLSYFEANKNIDFSIKRIYYIYDVPINTERGMHAHKKLQQVVWCPYGEIEITIDNGKDKTVYILNSPEKALLVLKGYWHYMRWIKESSVLCVAASDYYDEDDYIRDYEDYLNFIKEGYWKNED